MDPNSESTQSADNLRIELSALTDKGRVRKNNEDSFLALLPPNTPSGIEAILAVADGMGGQNAGEVASQMAIEGISRRFKSSRFDWAIGETAEVEEALRQLVISVNEDVFAEGSKSDRGSMGTTLTMALARADSVVVANVGDSRMYRLREGTLSQVTADHSFVAEQVALGILSEEEARTHNRRNVITRAIGIEGKVDVDVQTLSTLEDDVLLLCSDGLHGMINDDEITSLLGATPVTDAASQLVAFANEAGGNDNVTVIVARAINGGSSTSSIGSDPSAETMQFNLPRSYDTDSKGIAFAATPLRIMRAGIRSTLGRIINRRRDR